ncbi:hypothetical protein ACLOJK_007317 [Asimina triloba]
MDHAGVGFRWAMAGDRDLLASDEDGARKMLFGGADLGGDLLHWIERKGLDLGGRTLSVSLCLGRRRWRTVTARMEGAAGSGCSAGGRRGREGSNLTEEDDGGSGDLGSLAVAGSDGLLGSGGRANDHGGGSRLDRGRC